MHFMVVVVLFYFDYHVIHSERGLNNVTIMCYWPRGKGGVSYASYVSYDALSFYVYVKFL